MTMILLLTQFSSPSTAAAAPFNSTTTFDPSSSVAVSFSYSSSTSMALAVVIFLLVLFFSGFFSILARRFFAGVHSTSTAHRRPPFLLSNTTTTAHHRRRYLSPYYPAAGLDPLAVRALPALTYAGGRGEKDKEAAAGCVVCLGEFEAGERVKVIPGCGHVFHRCCIDGWLVLHGSCPICRCSQLWGSGLGADRNYVGEFWVGIDAGGGAHATESNDEEEEEDEEGRKLAGVGRSKSFRWEGAEDDSRVFLRRTCSV